MSKNRTPSNPSPARGYRLPFHWSYFLLAAFLAFFALKYIEKTHQVQGLARQEAALRYANQQVRADNTSTQNAISYARTMQYVEDTARQTLGYTLPGETSVVVIPQTPHHVARRVVPVQHMAPPAPTWRQWWSSFFG